MEISRIWGGYIVATRGGQTNEISGFRWNQIFCVKQLCCASSNESATHRTMNATRSSILWPMSLIFEPGLFREEGRTLSTFLYRAVKPRRNFRHFLLSFCESALKITEYRFAYNTFRNSQSHIGWCFPAEKENIRKSKMNFWISLSLSPTLSVVRPFHSTSNMKY